MCRKRLSLVNAHFCVVQSKLVFMNMDLTLDLNTNLEWMQNCSQADVVDFLVPCTMTVLYG